MLHQRNSKLIFFQQLDRLKIQFMNQPVIKQVKYRLKKLALKFK